MIGGSGASLAFLGGFDNQRLGPTAQGRDDHLFDRVEDLPVGISNRKCAEWVCVNTVLIGEMVDLGAWDRVRAPRLCRIAAKFSQTLKDRCSAVLRCEGVALR